MNDNRFHRDADCRRSRIELAATADHADAGDRQVRVRRSVIDAVVVTEPLEVIQFIMELRRVHGVFFAKAPHRRKRMIVIACCDREIDAPRIWQPDLGGIPRHHERREEFIIRPGPEVLTNRQIIP